MRTIRDVYKIGYGPSSSHTMGPARAARMFREAFPEADAFSVTLYGSLALTGKGHGTDRAILREFAPLPCDISFDAQTSPLPHPNTLDLTASKNGKELGRWRMLSIGGGDVLREGEQRRLPEEVYPHRSFSSVLDCCAAGGIRLWQYVEEAEGKEIWRYLAQVWQAMRNAVREGLAAKGVLPGGLNLERKAGYLLRQTHIDESPTTKENRLICAYAYAVAEQNASGGVVVTAPSCGSCGVLPAVLYYQQEKRGCSDEEVLHALAAAGVVGTLIKSNASVSGAECGCQAEIGSACSMAAAALGELFGLSLAEIEYAAEIAMEHMLGLTCDPVRGLVQIPCIERNAVAAMRAVNAVSLADFLSDTRKISFDAVVRTMYETGRDMPGKYRETSQGGLAALYDAPENEH